MRFDPGQLNDTFRKSVLQRIKEGRLSNTEGSKIIEFYEDQVESYTYLTPNGKEKSEIVKKWNCEKVEEVYSTRTD